MSLKEYNLRQVRLIRRLATRRGISVERAASLWVKDGYAVAFALKHERKVK